MFEFCCDYALHHLFIKTSFVLDWLLHNIKVFKIRFHAKYITYLLILCKLRLHQALKFYLLINHLYRNDNLVYFINFLDLYFSWRKIKKAYTKFECCDLRCCPALFSSIRCLFKFLTFFSKFSEEKSSKIKPWFWAKDFGIIEENSLKIFGPWWRLQRLAGLKLQVNNFQKVSFVYLCLLTYLS